MGLVGNQVLSALRIEDQSVPIDPLASIPSCGW
jgi:hypothetical protein